MSVVFINCTSETFTPTKSGAIATFLWELCTVAKAEGIEPTVITCPAEAEPFPWPKTIFVAQPPNPTAGWLVALCRLQRRLNGWRYLRQKAFAVRVVAEVRKQKLDQLPLIFHNDPEMAVLFHEEFPAAKIIHHFHNQHTCKEKMRKLFGQAKIQVTAVSDFTARWVEEFYALPKNTVETIYNGVDTEVFRPSGEEKSRLSVLNFVGRTGVEKAPDLLLKAALLLAEKRKDFSLQIVGGNHWGYSSPDEYQKELHALASQLETQEIKVHFTGFVTRPNMPAAFQQADIHVVPSRWDEPFGLTTVEGMASGLAIVASRTGGSPEVVGDAGLLFERENPADLAAQLEKLIDDPNLRISMAKKARERSLQFTWKATWRKFKAAASAESSTTKSPII